MDAVGPPIAVATARKIALDPAGVLGGPFGLQAADLVGGQPLPSSPYLLSRCSHKKVLTIPPMVPMFNANTDIDNIYTCGAGLTPRSIGQVSLTTHSIS